MPSSTTVNPVRVGIDLRYWHSIEPVQRNRVDVINDNPPNLPHPPKVRRSFWKRKRNIALNIESTHHDCIHMSHRSASIIRTIKVYFLYGKVWRMRYGYYRLNRHYHRYHLYPQRTKSVVIIISMTYWSDWVQWIGPVGYITAHRFVCIGRNELCYSLDETTYSLQQIYNET